MTEITIINESDLVVTTRGKSKTQSMKGSAFNIDTGKMYSIYPKEAKANDLPLFAYTTKMVKSKSFRNAIITDIRKELKKVKENIKNCNHETMVDLCKVSNLVRFQAPYLHNDNSFDLLDRDVIRAKEYFIEGCKLSRESNRKKK
jgi:serine/threonine-protein kinase RIO1